MHEHGSETAPDSAVSAAALAEARAIVHRAIGSRPVRVFLFGSRAAGTARATSDIDIALLADAPLPPLVVAELRDAFEASRIPYHVDVVDLTLVDASFRARVLAEGIPWDGEPSAPPPPAVPSARAKSSRSGHP